MHINEDPNLFDSRDYKKLAQQTSPTSSVFDSKEKIDYWKKWSPIGCRDFHTLQLFQKHNIPAYLSGCLTLSLQRTIKESTRNREVYVVDVHAQYPSLFQELVPSSIRQRAHYKTHIYTGSHEEKERVARNLMEIYQTCHYVITSRIHCAFVCLAYGTPVLFLHPDVDKDVRFQRMRLS